MYSKKVIFSFCTMPALGKNQSPINNKKLYNHMITYKYRFIIVLSHQAYEFQIRRKEDKLVETERR